MSIESERRRLYQKRSGEDQIFKGLLEENGRLEKENLRLTEIINKLVPGWNQPHKVRLILTKNINNSIYQIMNVNLAANQQQAFAFGLQDITNPAVIPTGTYSGGAVVSDTPGVATGNVDASGNVTFVAVAPGTANLVASAQTSFTDSLGVLQNQQLSTDPIPVTVIAVVTADGVKLVLIPGAITTQPAPVGSM